MKVWIDQAQYNLNSKENNPCSILQKYLKEIVLLFYEYIQRGHCINQIQQTFYHVIYYLLSKDEVPCLLINSYICPTQYLLLILFHIRIK